MASHNMGSKRSRSKRKQIIARDGAICYWCKEPFTLLGMRHSQIQYDATLDHIVEVKNGGTNDISNLVLAHRECNNYRSNPPRWMTDQK